MRRPTLGRPDSRPAPRILGAVFALLATAAWSAPCSAQELGPSFLTGADTTRGTFNAPLALPAVPGGPHVVRWWEVAAAAGGIGALMADDGNVLHEVQEHPTSGAGDVASVFRQAGDIKVYTALTLGTLGAGLLAKDAGITRTGAQLAASGVLAGASLGLLKVVTGRSRPDLGQGQGAYDFHPFGGGGSLPSGHAAMAFALATTLGDASHSTWARPRDST